MIWPPSKAISTTTRSLLAIRDQLHQDAVRSVGMKERDLVAEEAPSRFLVDELDALSGQLAEGRADIGDPVGDVVHAGSALGQELADRRVVAERREELDSPVADPQRRGFDTLVGDGLAMLDLRPENPLVSGHGLVEILDRDAEMVDSPGLHRGDSIGYSAGSETTLTVPTVSLEYESGSMSESSVSSSTRSSVSFSSSALATRSSAARCLLRRRWASS